LAPDGVQILYSFKMIGAACSTCTQNVFNKRLNNE
jgi:hypothetical protein